jgi:fluoride exporter
MKLLLFACAGGALGAGARYLVGVSVVRLLGAAVGFPWATLCVNIVGSFLMGLFIESLALRGSSSPELRVFIAVGVLGGFTTFSAFSLEFVMLMQRKEELAAGLYVVSSVTLSILALYMGLMMARQVLA